MSNVIYKYPQSSCACFDCDKKKFVQKTGIPTNLGLDDGDVNDYYECYNRNIFKQNVEPNNEKGTYFLNESVVNGPERNAVDFGYVDNCGTDCPSRTYLSMDPRLFDAKRGQRYAIDSPPLDDTVKLKDVYDEKFKNYGKNYKTYSDINAGNIVYYIDKSIQNAFFEPNFSEPAYDVGIIYQDPMGAIKPEYNRIPLIPQPNKATNNSSEYSPYRLSFIQDSQQHREDLMARQLRKTNQSRWEPRWTGLNKNIESQKPVPNPYSCISDSIF
jgi:hypothetical protein